MLRYIDIFTSPDSGSGASHCHIILIARGLTGDALVQAGCFVLLAQLLDRTPAECTRLVLRSADAGAVTRAVGRSAKTQEAMLLVCLVGCIWHIACLVLGEERALHAKSQELVGTTLASELLHEGLFANGTSELRRSM